jgi:transcriptional regulator with XRE-family HTH domain
MKSLQLAKSALLPPNTLSDLEYGRIVNPNRLLIQRLASALGVDPRALDPKQKPRTRWCDLYRTPPEGTTVNRFTLKGVRAGREVGSSFIGMTCAVSPAYVTHLEAGRIVRPDPRKLAAIADVLAVEDVRAFAYVN